MASDLQLDDMLNEHWLTAIGDLLRKQKDASKFLGVKRDAATIPARELTFTSLNQLPPKDINVVIFGQDPYPRAESAIGVAFNDGAIHKWTDKFSPSFANIVKNLLVGKGLVTVDQGVAEVRKVLAKHGIAQPPAWFEHTIKNGVCWLNTSLTFTSTDTSILAVHVAFWRPIIEGIIAALIDAKREAIKSGNPKAGLVFVLWGGHAQKLRKVVEKINQTGGKPIDLRFIDAPHPAATGNSFHTIKSFEAIDRALSELALPAIDWLPTSGAASQVATKKTASSKASSSNSVGDSEDDVKNPTKKSAGKKATAAKKAAMDVDSDEDESKPKTKKVTAAKKATGAKASASKKRVREEDEDDGSDFEVEAPKAKRAKKAGK